jgi:hypothetical protein
MGFFNGPKNWDQVMTGKAGLTSVELMPHPIFKMSVNKAFEFVTLFGPALYYQNPVRTVTPRSPLELPMEFFPDPYLAQAIYAQQQQELMVDSLRATVVEKYLNWTPIEGKLADQSRQAIEEALIKGRGCLWTELDTPPGTTFKVVTSQFDTVDNLFVDPDAPSLDKATWIARRCVPSGLAGRAAVRPGPRHDQGEHGVAGDPGRDRERRDAQFDRKRGLTNDLLVYWKIYSKMGIGGRLTGMPRRMRGPLEMFGDYCYVVIAKDVPFLLNLPPDLTERRLRRPTRPCPRSSTAWPGRPRSGRTAAGRSPASTSTRSQLPLADGPPARRPRGAEVPQLGDELHHRQDPQHEPGFHRHQEGSR